MNSAAAHGILSCHSCGLVSRASKNQHDMVCSRCETSLHFRKNNSISRAWAFLIAAYVFIIPANLLLVSVQRRSTFQPKNRTKLYRVLEFVGRWSMIDVYVAAMLTALVQFGSVMSIRVGNGAIAFGAVVVLTILAAESFDPRLIWDSIGKTKNNENFSKEKHV